MNNSDGRSILVKLALAQGALVVVLFAIFLGFATWNESTRANLQFEAQAKEKAELLSMALAPQLYNFSADNAAKVIERFLGQPGNFRAKVLDEKGASFAEKSRDGQAVRPVTVTHSLEYDGKVIGSLEIDLDVNEVDKALVGQISFSILTNLTLLVLLLVGMRFRFDHIVVDGETYLVRVHQRDLMESTGRTTPACAASRPNDDGVRADHALRADSARTRREFRAT